jgi:hypothetical protein
VVPLGPKQIPPESNASWFLEADYDLDGQVTETDPPPGPQNSPALGTVTDSYSVTGHVAEFLVPPGPPNSPAWLFNTVVSGQGEVSVSFEKGDPSAPLIIGESFRDTTAIAQVCRDTSGGLVWAIDAAVATQGTLAGTGSDGGQLVTTGRRNYDPIHIDRGVSATLAALDPSGNPGPAWRVAATEVVVTKDPDAPADNGLTAVRAGLVVLHRGRFDLEDTLEATVTPPPTPAGPAPPVTVSQETEVMGDFQGVWIDLES